MAQLFTNGGFSTLASGIGSGDTSFSVASGHGSRFPTPTGGDYFVLTLTQAGATETSWEEVRCTARSGDTLTITRAQEGTSAAAWSAGDKVELRVTAAYLNRVSNAANGGGTDAVFYENDQTVNNDYTLTANKNAMSAGPVTVTSGKTVTVPPGASWTVV